MSDDDEIAGCVVYETINKSARSVATGHNYAADEMARHASREERGGESGFLAATRLEGDT